MPATRSRLGALALLLLLPTAGCGESDPDGSERTASSVSPSVTSAAPSGTAPEGVPEGGPESTPETGPGVQPEPLRTGPPRTRPPETRPPRTRPPQTPGQPSPAPSVDVPRLEVPPSSNRPVLGGDVSWPQCPKGMGIPERPAQGMPMPLPSARFVILGLTNGPAFTPNPCLADQVRWVRRRNLMAAAYAVSSYPDDATLRRYGDRGPFDGSTRLGALRNVGYQQAVYNLATMRAAGLRSPIVWLDVEPVLLFEWSADKVANAAVVEGAARGYLDAGFQIGAYSTPLLWETVVGDFTLGGVPEWRAAGETSMAEALDRCGPDWSFQGGPGVIGQWVEDDRDRNVTCPGASRQMFRWFAQY